MEHHVQSVKAIRAKLQELGLNDHFALIKTDPTWFDCGTAVLPIPQTLQGLFKTLEVKLETGADENSVGIKLHYCYTHLNGGRNGKTVTFMFHGDEWVIEGL